MDDLGVGTMKCTILGYGGQKQRQGLVYEIGLVGQMIMVYVFQVFPSSSCFSCMQTVTHITGVFLRSLVDVIHAIPPGEGD